MTAVSPQGYSRLFATGLFLSTEDTPKPTPGDRSRSTTPTPITTAPHTPAFEFPPAPNYTGSTALSPSTLTSSSTRRPKLAALRTFSSRSMNGVPQASGPTSASASAPSSPRVLRRRRSSVTLSHNPLAGIKSPTRAAGMSGKLMQALGNVSPGKERRACSLDMAGENARRTRKITIARKPPPTSPLPLPPVPGLSTQFLPPPPTLTLNTTLPSPMNLSPALTPSPNILPAPTPLSGVHKFSLANMNKRPGRSPLVPVADVNLGYFDVPVIRDSSPVLPENEMDTN
ncbi:hypothetical protein RhiJN_01445 [Ceratobasidium sp. AG-Ba]|nr:hypothetical protein RhiJN_01445 [Ceratobasidium sp. AG-Ba]QRW02436.1 hypothetical protein RhiLY_01434 [Ceratobasidium sp. AG-Ba]